MADEVIENGTCRILRMVLPDEKIREVEALLREVNISL